MVIDTAETQAEHVQGMADGRPETRLWRCRGCGYVCRESYISRREHFGNPATPVVSANAHFDTYEAYNPTVIDQAGSSYTVNDGDTLQSIAENLWSDASLWYLLAEANGLGEGQTLLVGQVLSVPSQVTSVHNNASTFKPYNPADALGNTNPTQPRPPAQASAAKKGCGTFGQILTVIVAIAVTAIVAPYAIAAVANMGAAATAATVAGGALAGAAGSIASQGFAIATGNQDKFSWSAVATSAIAGGVGGAFAGKFSTLGPVGGAVARAVTGNAVSQGINMAVGLQKKFDWTGLAVAGVAGGVVGALETTSWFKGKVSGGIEQGVAKGAAALLAGAATRTLLTGQDFGRSLQEALPDAIGQTVGSMIGDAIVSRSKIPESWKGKFDQADAPDPKSSIVFPAVMINADGSRKTVYLPAGETIQVGGGATAGRRSWWEKAGDFVGLDGQFGTQGSTTQSFSLRGFGRAVSSTFNFSTANTGRNSSYPITAGDDTVVVVTGQRPSWWDKTRSWISTTYSSIKSRAGDALRNAAYSAPETQFFNWSAQQLDRGGHKGLATVSRSIGTYNAEFKIGAVQALGGMVEGMGSLAYNANPIGWVNYGASKLGMNVAPGAPNAGTIGEPMNRLIGDSLGYVGDAFMGTANPIADGSRLVSDYADGWKTTASQGPEALARRAGNFSGSAAVEIGSLLLPASKVSKFSTLTRAGGAAERLVASEVVAAETAAPRVGPQLLSTEGNVGTFRDLIKAGSKGDDITPNHIPSANRMSLEGVSKGDGIAINMEHPVPGVGGRHRATFTYGTQADINMSARDALAAGIWDTRQIYRADGLYTPQIRSSLQDVIKLNKTNHPTIFVKEGQ